MLRSLHIENIAVIREADLTFSKGLSVLTGETGAGKSVLIDSIGFLIGGKVGKELIRSGEKQALVSAVFSDVGEVAERIAGENGISPDEGEYLLQRTFGGDGKSTARINGRPVTQGMLREIGGAFLVIHGQHDSLRLIQPDEQLSAVDSYAGDATELNAYKVAYEKLCAVRKEMERLRTNENERARQVEILQYQIRDIDAKKLKQGEEEILVAERDKLRSLEKIVKQVNLTCRILTDNEQGNVSSWIDRAVNALGQIEHVVPEASEIREKLSAMRYEVTDLSEYVRELVPETDGDPTERLDKIEGRLEAISRLKKKYGSTVEEILEFRRVASERLAELENADGRIAELTDVERRLREDAEKSAAVLSDLRKRASVEISAEVVKALAFMDMPKVRFDISLTSATLSLSGADHVEYLLAANAGEPLAPMSKIASGGELSRIMLALSDVLNKNAGSGTVIYDEIDTGISGGTSRKVGMKLKQSARRVQTLCVTHSAQIASLADSHFFISKEEKNGRTETSVRELSGEQRVNEISRILGGIHITDAQRAAAMEMIEEGKSL